MSNHHKHHRTNEVRNLIRAAIGNLSTVDTMIQDQQSCVEIVKRLTAIMNLISEGRGVVAKDHVASCMREVSDQSSADKIVNDLSSMIQNFMPSSGSGSHH
ncbi:MAG: metal-sensing transcriptional repressor [Bdellovibrionaceae bacterium]|nr:metal-sensing transcriptional repressor [Pseudobdellovibrionaceae bacterium]